MDFKPAPRCGQMIRARRFSNGAELAQAIADLLAHACSSSMTEPHAVMLSGGSTPMAAYQMLALARPKVSTALRLLFSDDRHVPSDSPKSNYGNILQYTDALAIPADRVLHVHGEIPLDEAARRYNDDLDEFVSQGGRVTVGLLGLGTDGHTASLFKKEHVERDAGPWAIAVQRPDGLNGVSVTPAFLRRVERIVFMVAGADKRPMTARLLKEPDTIPAGMAVKGHPAVELWMDPAAWPL